MTSPLDRLRERLKEMTPGIAYYPVFPKEDYLRLAQDAIRLAEAYLEAGAFFYYDGNAVNSSATEYCKRKLNRRAAEILNSKEG